MLYDMVKAVLFREAVLFLDACFKKSKPALEEYACLLLGRTYCKPIGFYQPLRIRLRFRELVLS